MDLEYMPGEDDQLKAENDFLKMKLMLEKGAHFISANRDDELPPEIEHEFLKRVMDFEEQWETPKIIKVFDKIERPSHFKPAAEIPDDKMDDAWKELVEYLGRYGISLDACSPNITTRELYRFAVEELFLYEINDINIPGIVSGFIYDEFHPDPVYDNAVMATEECLSPIFKTEPMEWMHYFKEEGLRLNNRTSLTRDSMKAIINRFKLAYDEISLEAIHSMGCIVEGAKSQAKGTYTAIAKTSVETFQFSGNWEVYFEKDPDMGYWCISEVEIEGINF